MPGNANPGLHRFFHADRIQPGRGYIHPQCQNNCNPDLGKHIPGWSKFSFVRASFSLPTGLERLLRKRIVLFIFVGLAERAIVGRFGFEWPWCFEFWSGFGRYTNHYQLPDPENNEQTKDDDEKELV